MGASPVEPIEGWEWNAQLQLYSRYFYSLLGCVSRNFTPGAVPWRAAYGAEKLSYYVEGAQDFFDDPRDAAKAVEDYARVCGWEGD